MKKKALAIFEDFSLVSGAEVSNSLLLDCLEKEYSVERVFLKNKFLNCLPVNAALFFKTLFWKGRIKKLIEEKKPAILITHHQLTVPCHRAAQKEKIPIITFVRNWWFLTPNRREFEKHLLGSKLSISKKLIGLVDFVFCLWSKKAIKGALEYSRVFAVSEFVKKKLKKAVGVESEVLWSFVKEKFFIKKPALRKKFLSRTMLFVGRLKQEKGIHLIIEAMRKVDGKLVIIGVAKSPYAEYCKKLAKQSGIKGKVVFLGEIKHEKVILYIKNSSCVVVPSLWQEPFGRSCVEAMAAATPPIITNSGGMAKGIPKQLVVEQTPEAFAAKINLILGNFSLYTSLARSSQQHAKKYSFEKICPRFVGIVKKEIG